MEALRGELSGHSSPMAWEGGPGAGQLQGGRTSSAGAAAFEAALEMETSSQASSTGAASSTTSGRRLGRSCRGGGSWSSQRALEAQVAELRQALDVAAAAQVRALCAYPCSSLHSLNQVSGGLHWTMRCHALSNDSVACRPCCNSASCQACVH